MATKHDLSPEDKEFLRVCEEELKDRYTENDEDFMKVLNKGPSIPPIIPNWWSNNQRDDNRRYHQNNKRRYGGDEHRYNKQRRYN